jgi:glucokinase
MNIIGIDLGGTQLRAARVADGRPGPVQRMRINASGSPQQVLDQLYNLVDPLMEEGAGAIGIGVPSVVDMTTGIVYDVQNIPSWKEVHLKQLLEARYRVPVEVNNDANCFALAEKHFGQGRRLHSFVALAIGTGLGAGIIIADRLYPGRNTGAGEFGMVDYRDHCYEYYASGQFFEHSDGESGKSLAARAEAGDAGALEGFRLFGGHLGEAVKMILYTYDPEMIILGGSVSASYALFRESMWDAIGTFGYPASLEHFSIRVSELRDAGILGAAALCEGN